MENVVPIGYVVPIGFVTIVVVVIVVAAATLFSVANAKSDCSRRHISICTGPYIFMTVIFPS
jgi:hypothetical protein